MNNITKGGNVAIAGARVVARISLATGSADVSAYVLDASGKTRSDDDMVFYNQPKGVDGAVSLSGMEFTLDLAKIPSAVDRVAICAVPETGTVETLGIVTLDAGEFSFVQPMEGMKEGAVIIGEFYRRADAWKFRAVAQGFNGGLDPLSRHFGIDVADAPAVAPAAAPAKVDLRKERLVSLEKTDPKLVSLAKTARVSLEKKSLAGTTAKVVLALDISASMSNRYRSGEVDRLVQRVLGMGLNLDDDGSIEAYAFGTGAYRIGIADANNYKTFVPEMLRKRSLEGSTHYGATIEMIRRDYGSQSDFGRIPVFVIFVTDGDTQDRALTEREIRDASAEGIFWQFVGIGGSGPFSSGFNFLEKLDDLGGRKIDNCDFFSVTSADAPTDVELYDMLMSEYPGWLIEAKKAGVLR